MKPDINDVIKQIARQEGVSEREVIAEMQKTIDEGYDNPDPAIRARWAAMPFCGKPTPQDLIACLAAQMREGTPH